MKSKVKNNKSKKINISHKSNLYVGFQMISTFVFITFLLAVILIMYNISKNVYKIDKNFIKEYWNDLLTFKWEGAINKMVSILIYLTFILLIISWIVGWMASLTNDRNYYDQMFLMFLLIPFISSLFCLMAQLKIRIKDYESSRITKEDVKFAAKALEEKVNNLKKEEMKKYKGIAK